MAMYYNGKKVRNLYFNGKCITRLALGKEMTRLVEGDDFVRAKWLVCTVLGNKTLMNLGLPSEDFSYSRIYSQIGNTSHLAANGYAYFSTSLTEMAIWNGSSTINYKNIGIGNLSVKCDANSLTFNQVDFPKYGFPAFITFNNANSADTIFKQSSVIVDGVERYIPCRLLRPIPAALDGNGIARNADECGMYDSVSGKFYGNVASSGGTFTVSDN